jgi:DNA-binding response OmpR family regulator
MKALAIEDNTMLAQSIKDFLKPLWVVDTADNGEDGVEFAKTNPYDAIILDLGLPGMDGEDVCLAIRKAGIATPIIILSGVSETDTKVSLLNNGADDYLTKPFKSNELQARLNALIRRGPQNDKNPDLLKVDNLVLNPHKREVKRGTRNIELRRKEFDILEYLMRNQGKVVSRPMIISQVWDSHSETWNSTVDVHIKYLRDKIDKPYKRKLIKTAHGVGYTIHK